MTFKKTLITGLAALVLAFTAPNCGGSPDGSDGDDPVNKAPKVKITQPADGSFIYRGQSLSFDATCYDPDGKIATEGWEFEGLLGSVDYLTGNEVVPTDSSLGTYILTAYCIDNKGKIGEDQIGMDVRNNPPVANAGSDSFALAGISTVNLNGSGSYDIDGNISKCEWDYEGEGTYEFVSTTTCTTTHVYPTVGNFNAKLRVTDNNGDQNIDTKLVQVN